MKKGHRFQKNGFTIRKSTIDGYETLLKHLINYQSFKKTTLCIKDWETLNTRAKTAETAYWKRFYLGFSNYLFNKCGHFDNHVGANMKLLRAFFKWLEEEMIVNTGPSSRLIDSGFLDLLKRLLSNII